MASKRFQYHVNHLRSDFEARKVFSDPGQRRQRRFRWVVLFFVLLLPIWGTLFLKDAVSWSSLRQDLEAYLPIAHAPKPSLDLYNGAEEQSKFILTASAATIEGTASCEQATPLPFAAMADETTPRSVFAHIPATLDWAHLSLNNSCDTLGTIIPDWIVLNEQSGDLSVSVMPKGKRSLVTDFTANAAVTPDLMPTIQLNENSTADSFVEAMLVSETQETVLADLLSATQSLQVQGACIDFGQLRAKDFVQLQPFFVSLQQAFRQSGMVSCVVLPAEGKTWRNREFVRGFDKVVLQIFSQPWTGSTPEPLATDAWVAETAAAAKDIIGADRLVAAIGTFAVDWASGNPMPEVIPYAEAMYRISSSDADLQFSAKTSNSFSSYRNKSGVIHKLWLLDAASAHNQLKILASLNIFNVAIWSAGQEDPGLWKVLAHEGNSPVSLAADLTLVQFENYVHYDGEGALLKIRSKEHFGVRAFDFDPSSGRIVGQSYSVYPTPYSLERYGKPSARKLVLTFDDGPVREATQPILDTLRDLGVPAAFFLVGTNVMNEPGLVQRMVNEGHEIGSHSFSHPRMEKISAARAELEFSLVSKAIAGAAGRDTHLYRAPFQRSGGPIRAESVASLETAQANGSFIAGMDITPRDWDGLSARQIVDHVIEQVEAGGGNVILLHDGGLDPSQSVAAVPILVAELRALGYEFTSISDLLGMERNTLMPVVGGAAPVIDRISFAAVSATQNSVILIFWIVLCIGLARSGGILILALLRRQKHPLKWVNQSKISIIIPAYNEEKGIAKCIESVLASDYPNFEVIVVDDGSTDNTLNEILKFKHQTNVRLITQPNQGKWAALNRAILTLDTELTVCIDADTQIRRSTISRMVRHFSDPKVGAVAGKIIVGNRVNLLTRLQALEYAISQNMERKAYDLINGMLVVPGAIGAWRVQALRDGGLFCRDTMTEDSDLTISVNRAEYRIVYDETACAYTEAPERVGQLITQRLRWSLGMLQSAWKHKKAILERRAIGFVSIPDMIIFGYIFPLLAPIADLLVLVLLFRYFQGGSDAASPELFWAFLALPVLDLLVAAVALAQDKDESFWSLLLWPVHRVFYRPLLYYSVIRSLTRAITGRLANWGKQNRQGRDYGLVKQGR